MIIAPAYSSCRHDSAKPYRRSMDINDS